MIVLRLAHAPTGFRTFRHQKSLSRSLGILHLVAPANVGGLESVVRLLSRGQRLAGHQVTVGAVVDPKVADHRFLDALAADGTKIAIMRVPGRSYVQERRAVRLLCKAEQPDIVHTHGYRSDIVDSMAARSLELPIVTTIHGFTGGDLRNRINEWLQLRYVRDFDGVVAVSEHLADRLRRNGLGSAELHIVRNAYDHDHPMLERGAARLRLGVRSDEFVVGWVGRLSREKGADLLLNALPRLRKDGLRVMVMGDGPERGALESRARTLGVADTVRWCGVVAEAGSLFPGFDAFVLSSRTEGLPVVLLEAMAAHAPIVATRVGGVPEMLTSDEAWLVPADDPPALAVAISQVRDDPVAARGRAAAARARLERDFSLEPWVRAYDRVYDLASRLCAARRR